MTKMPEPVLPLPVHDDARERQIADYAIDQLFRTMPGIAAALPVMPLVLGYLMWDHVGRGQLLAWIAATLAIVVVRLGLARAHARAHVREPGADKRRWAHYFTLTSLASGLTWGYAGIAFFIPGEVALQVFLYVAIVGLAAASIIITSLWLPAYYAYALPSISLSALRLVYEDGAAYQGLAVLLLMYIVILAQAARRQREGAFEVVRLRFQNLDLVAQLHGQKELAERAREAAEQSNLAKSKFLAAASHDLRQPLHALGLFVAALNDRITYPGVRVLMDNINRSVTALGSLLDALLDISKLDAGTVQPHIEALDLGLLLEQLSAEFAPQARDKGLAWEASATGAWVCTDAVLLVTILRNLLSNALRYTPAGRIRIACRQEGDRVQVEIADTGIGIAPRHQEEVFHEFVQLHNPERDREKGLGLGLAIVDRLCRLLGFPLELHSEPGVGTRFRLTLPACAPNPAVPEAAEPAARQSADIFVLVIDDEAAVREAMATLLADWGYRTLVAASQEDALAQLDQAPDVIVADYRLREERTGVEAIDAIKATWGADIPALIVTGDTAPERLRQAQESGYSLLHKPVPPAKLRAFLRGTARRRAAPAAGLTATCTPPSG